MKILVMATTMDNPMVDKFNSTTRVLHYNNTDIIMGKGVLAVTDNMPVRAEATLCCIGRCGTMQFCFMGRTLQLHAGELFIFPMNATISDFLFSTDYSGDFIALDNLMADDAFRSVHDGQRLLKSLYEHPVFSMNESQQHLLSDTFDSIYHALEHDYYHGKDMVVKRLADAFVAVVTEIMRSRLGFDEREVKSHLHGDALVREFIILQQDATQPGRSVGHLASRLNVTPKYLSTLVRQSTGKSPMQIITETTVQAIINRLIYSTDSIKQIAMTLHFDNPSFFGKYCRKHLGMSPTAYRLAHRR